MGGMHARREYKYRSVVQSGGELSAEVESGVVGIVRVSWVGRKQWEGAGQSGVVVQVEVAVDRRKAACVVDITEEVVDSLGVREQRLEGVGCRADSVCHPCTCVAIRDAVEDEVRNGLARVAAGGAAGGVRLRDAVEVIVQGGVSGAQL